MNILSVCNGISCGRVAADRADLKVDNYFSSEINEKAIEVSDENYPQDIKNKLGDITKWKEWNIPNIDLLIGGTPCQGLSRAKTDRENLIDIRSKLFYDYVDIKNNCNPKYFLLENVCMDKDSEDIISELLGVQPILINSNLVSAQNRKRLYWTNIPNVTLPNDKAIFLKDIVYDMDYKLFQDERIEKTKKYTKNYVKWDMSGKNYGSQQDRAYYLTGKMCTLPKQQPLSKCNIQVAETVYKRCHPIEGERLQTLPDNYTDIIKSPNDRLGLCGDGWTVDVIAHIFKGLK